MLRIKLRRIGAFSKLALAFAFIQAVAVGQQIPLRTGPEFIPGKYIVMLDSGRVFDGFVRGAKPVTSGFENRVTHRYSTSIEGFAAELTDAELMKLAMDPRVLHIEQDQVVRLSGKPGGGGGGGGGGSTQPAQVIPWGISKILATQSSAVAGDGAGSVNVDVAVIDTGIDLAHPDLTVAGGRNFTGGSPTNYGDANGHGTHVAGTIAAKDNAIGVVGWHLAPGCGLCVCSTETGLAQCRA